MNEHEISPTRDKKISILKESLDYTLIYKRVVENM